MDKPEISLEKKYLINLFRNETLELSMIEFNLTQFLARKDDFTLFINFYPSEGFCMEFNDYTTGWTVKEFIDYNPEVSFEIDILHCFYQSDRNGKKEIEQIIEFE